MRIFRQCRIACQVMVLGLLFSALPTASAEVLTLNKALEQAVSGSYDYRLAKLSANISKTDIQIARAEYFPQIKGYVNLEKLNGLDDQARSYAVVGNNVIPGMSQYQNAGGLQLSQTLWDFGQRSFKVKIAKTDVASKELQAEQVIRDLKLKVIDAYTNALITYQGAHTKQLIVPLYQELFKLDERLHEAGYLSKVQLSEDAIALAQALDEAQTLQNQWHEQLQTLSQLTQMNYDPNDIELSELEVEPENTVTPDWKADQSLDAKTYKLEIDKKKTEVSLLKRQYLPQLAAYSNYNLYGSAVQGLGAALQNTQSRSLTMGVNMSIPVFDGFRLQGQIDKAQLEVERLQLEREKKLFELSKKADAYRTQSASAEQSLLTKKGWVAQVQEKLVMMQRLSEGQVVDKTKVVKETIQQIESGFEHYKIEVQKAAAVKKLEVLYTS